AERHRQRTSEIIEAYPPQFIDERRKHGHPETGGIYVAGMPRSGTTLTEQILAAHSLVHAGGESLDVAHTVKAMAGWPGNAATLPPEDFTAQGQRLHADLFAQAGGKPFATDKTPGNFMFFGALACALPAAKLVYVKRSPGDNAISLF